MSEDYLWIYFVAGIVLAVSVFLMPKIIRSADDYVDKKAKKKKELADEEKKTRYKTF